MSYIYLSIFLYGHFEFHFSVRSNSVMSTHTISQVLAWVTQCREIKEAMQVACSPE
jgi:hypothetical protein